MPWDSCGRTFAVLLGVSLMASACGGGESNGPSSPSSTTAGPTITAVTPNTGPAAGGTVVTITGTRFASGAAVTIGGVAATNVQVSSVIKITATTGAASAGAGDVVVTTGGQTGRLADAFTFLGSVSVTVQAYLSPGGLRRTFSKAGQGGTAMQVCLSELGLTGIDTQRVALRQPVVDGHVGDYMAASKSGGCASFTPMSDVTIAAYAFATDIYDTMDTNVNGNKQTLPKIATAYIYPAFPVSTAELQAVDNMLAAYNSGFGQSGSSAGRLSRFAGAGNIMIRFNPAATFGGSNNGEDRITINTPLCISKNRDIQGVLIEEMFYILNHVYDPTYPFGPRNPDDRTLSQRGANLTNYTYLMSPKNWSGTTALPAVSALLFGPVDSVHRRDGLDGPVGC